MQKDSIEQKVEKIVETLLTGTDMQLIDVEYVREGQWYLRVFLDKQGGIEIDDCKNISEKLAKILDEEDLVKEHYYLEVSSPGLDRKLRKDRDFQRHQGDTVDIKLKKEKHVIVGVLQDFSEDFIQISVDGKEEKIERNAISSIRLHLDF